MKVLFLNGLPDHHHNLFSVKCNTLLVHCNGSSNVGNYISIPRYEHISAIVGIDDYKVLLEHRGEITCIFNEISDTDSHSKSLKEAAVIVNTLDVPVINHPIYIMETSRDAVYRRLSDMDEQLIVPKTIKVEGGSLLSRIVSDEHLRYPIILRGAGSHGGCDTVLIQDSIQLDSYSKTLVVGDFYYLTEYHEYKNEDNLYTKCRLLIIDGQVYIRHWIHSKHWLVHARNRRREYDLMEKKKIQTFDHALKEKLQPLMTKIYHRVKLDYFGIDCHIDKHMNVLLFELNATMDVFTSSGGSEHLAVQNLQEAVHRLILNKVAIHH